MDGIRGWWQERSHIEKHAIAWGVFFGLWLVAGGIMTAAGIQ